MGSDDYPHISFNLKINIVDLGILKIVGSKVRYLFLKIIYYETHFVTKRFSYQRQINRNEANM